MRRVDVAIEAAKVAGAVIQSRNGAELNIQEKDSSRTSIVTAADLRSQQEVIRTIRRAFPHDLIVGEEGRETAKALRHRGGMSIRSMERPTTLTGCHSTAYRSPIAMQTVSRPG
jgi:fructose-1,6-bisphosphatase/inositol monophosphatase family enzyme